MVFSIQNMLNSSFVEKNFEQRYPVYVQGTTGLCWERIKGGWPTVFCCRLILTQTHLTPSNHGQCGSLPFLYLTLSFLCVAGKACLSQLTGGGDEKTKKDDNKKQWSSSLYDVHDQIPSILVRSKKKSFQVHGNYKVTRYRFNVFFGTKGKL